MNEEKFKKYLGIANHDIQAANGTMELKSYVASILYEIDNLQSKIDKAIEYIEKHLEEHIIEDQPDEQSIFYDEKGYYIPNAKEQLLDILKGSK